MAKVFRFLFCFSLLFPIKSPQADTLFFSGDLRGEIKPCGCDEEGDMGGLLRRATFLKQHSIKDSFLYFDLGNNFPEPSEQGDLKVRLIQQSMKLMQPSVVLLGPNEWSYGQEFIDLELPYLLSNAIEASPYLKHFQTRLGHLSIAVWGYLSPELIYQNPNEQPLVLKNDSKLLTDWKHQKESGLADRNLLLFRGYSKELERFQKSGLFEMIIVGSDNEDELKQRLFIDTQFGKELMIPTKGQGIVGGVWNEANKFESIGEFEITKGLGVSWLRKDLQDDPRLLPLFKAYNEKVKALFFRNLDRMETQSRESPFTGSVTCSGCHLEAVKVWEGSNHSHAFQTLQKENKHFDPECLECHVVGLKPWLLPEGTDESMKKWAGMHGFLSPKLTPHLKNVQCENCHGPSRAHLANPNVKPPTTNPSNGCTNCHHGSHSPIFDYRTYWPKIEHK